MTTCWDARIRRGAGGALLLLAMGAATPAAGAPAQVPAASIVATPSTVVAGGDVSLSGQCPAGTTNAALQVFFFIGDHGMWLDTTASALADGTFLTSITVPSDAEAGLWAAAVDCDGLGTDVAETAFEVTGGGEPMVLAPESFPVGGPLHLESSGCVASGVLLDTTTIVVYLDADEGLSLLTIVAVPTNPDGSWSADVALPPEAAGADLFVTVECAADGGWVRYAEAIVFPAQIPTTTLPTTTPTTPTTTRAVLPRTGPPVGRSWSLPLVGCALVAAGFSVKRAAARRSPALP